MQMRFEVKSSRMATWILAVQLILDISFLSFLGKEKA